MGTYYPRHGPTGRGRPKRQGLPSGETARTWRSGCGPSLCTLFDRKYPNIISGRITHTQGSVLPVPYPNGLVVAGADDPGELVVEEYGSDIVEMAVQGEQAPPSLVGPDFDLIVVASRHKERLQRISSCP